MIRSLLAFLVLCLATSVATAQTPPTGLPPGGTLGEDSKPAGAAEKAPKDDKELPTVPILPPWPGQKKKELRVFELNGYLRVRTDWLKNFHLGFHDLGQGVPFREPLRCRETADLAVRTLPCSGTGINSANMRLRLEPIINVSEDVRVKAQIDVLDNLVLGGTPDGVFYDGTVSPANVPVSAFSGSQAPPEAGRNYISDSITVKRAWAEVKTPIGLLKFGRMPSHWGMGILANSGGLNTFSGDYCQDCDYGDTADRIFFGTIIPGTQFRFAVARDWPTVGATAAHSDIWLNRTAGQPWDLEDDDDVTQWVFVLARLDSPAVWRDKIEQGELALNYGAYVVRRTQSIDAKTTTLGSSSPEANLGLRGASAWIPDVYFRLGYQKTLVEAEAVVIQGHIDDLTSVGGILDQDIFQVGGVLRFSQLLADDALKAGIEFGYASGDQWDATLQGQTNVRDVLTISQLASDKTITNFKFDFDYHVDLILFRELIGAVTNATYIKPSFSYNLTSSIKFSAQAIISFANVPVATPGNGNFWGMEFDGDLGYNNEKEGFFAGISYGIYLPGNAMDHPADLFDPMGLDDREVGQAKTAQTIQTRLVVKF